MNQQHHFDMFFSVLPFGINILLFLLNIPPKNFPNKKIFRIVLIQAFLTKIELIWKITSHFSIFITARKAKQKPIRNEKISSSNHLCASLSKEMPGIPRTETFENPEIHRLNKYKIKNIAELEFQTKRKRY